MSAISTFIAGSPSRPAPRGITGDAQPGRHVALVNGTAQPVPIGSHGALAVDHRDPGLSLGDYGDDTATRPVIYDCGVIAVEVKSGNRNIACVPAANAPLPRDALITDAAQNLARYKQPRAYHHLPRNANGKPNRRALRHFLTNQA